MSEQVPNSFYVALYKQDGKTVGHHLTSDLDVLAEKIDNIEDAIKQEEVKPLVYNGDLNFRKVHDSLVSQMETYRNFIAFTIELAPLVSTEIARTGIENFTLEKGHKVEDASSEKMDVYSLDYSHLREFMSRNEAVASALNGAKHLPEVMVIGLISVYDAFLSDLLFVILSTHQEIVLTSEKELKLSDLMKYSTIDEARQSIIKKEIESALRSSHHEQFSWMEKRFSVKLREGLDCWSTFIEICERRNLLTHTGGIISDVYLSNCKSHGVDIKNLVVGQKAEVDALYYKNSVLCVYEISVKLCQVLWRKMAQKEVELADSCLVSLTYDLINKRVYPLAEILLRFGIDVLRKHSSDKMRRMMVVNLANAVRLQGRDDEARMIISKEDWSASSQLFKVCIASVLGDIDEVISQMRLIGPSGEISEQDYRNWPVFRRIRSDKRFQMCFEEVFKSRIEPN